MSKTCGKCQNPGCKDCFPKNRCERDASFIPPELTEESVGSMIKNAMQKIYIHMKAEFPGMTEEQIDLMVINLITTDEVLLKRMLKGTDLPQSQ